MGQNPDINVVRDTLTCTLQAGTERAHQWLQRVAGATGREIELDPLQAEDLCNRAREEGFVVTNDLDLHTTR